MSSSLSKVASLRNKCNHRPDIIQSWQKGLFVWWQWFFHTDWTYLKSHDSFTTLYHYTVCRIACHTSRSLYVAHGTRLLDHCFVCKSTKDRTFLKGCTNRNWQELEGPAGRKLIGSWSPSGAHLEPIWLRIFEYLLFDFFKSSNTFQHLPTPSNTFQLCPRQPMAARGRGNTVPLRLEIVDAVRVQNGAAWMEYSKAWRRFFIRN